MTCSHCKKEIKKLADYYSRTECRTCYNKRMKKYQNKRYHNERSAYTNRLSALYKEIICG